MDMDKCRGLEICFGWSLAPAVGVSLLSSGRFQILDPRYVDDGALGEKLRQSVRIQVNPNLDRIPFHEGHVVIRDVVGFPIGQANPERFERLEVQPLLKLLRRKHNQQSAGQFVMLISHSP